MTAAAIACCVVSACESPVPFYPPGEGPPDDPVIGLGGPAPVAVATRPRPTAEPPTAPPDVYAATRAGVLSPAIRALPPRLYVPNAATGAVDVLALPGGRLVGRHPVPGGRRGRVVPSWNLTWLWIVGRDGLTPVNARSGRRGRVRPVPRVKGLYFAGHGRDAVTVTARSVVFRHPVTMRARAALRLPCTGTPHADLSADEDVLLLSCVRPGRLVRIDVARRVATGVLTLPAGSHPLDVRLSPDGSLFYVADPVKGGVWLVDAAGLRTTGFIPTGPGAHSLLPSRDSRSLHVLGDGSLTTLDVATRRVTSRRRLPYDDASAPAGLTSDGTALWLTAPGRVYAFSPRTGRPTRTLPVTGRPANALLYPQPAHHSLGGTNRFR
ncbi:hypothetical protein Arub01_58690 [Actinomadura rubrobrunea]|uniref:YncE family protein n=2 Tax=Actinomadura rubrobrunea TaxID=115335 RepID=A0A9W6Q332_9ACTN|nr:hypothetical protein Arub01_58690 [Actinomadura rubrobrunea]